MKLFYIANYLPLKVRKQGTKRDLHTQQTQQGAPQQVFTQCHYHKYIVYSQALYSQIDIFFNFSLFDVDTLKFFLN